MARRRCPGGAPEGGPAGLGAPQLAPDQRRVRRALRSCSPFPAGSSRRGSTWPDHVAEISGRVAAPAWTSGSASLTDRRRNPRRSASRPTQREGHERFENGPQAVVVPLLAGPHPDFDASDRRRRSARRRSPVMLATALGPHPLLAGALHDRLYEVGVARASRASGLNIAAGRDRRHRGRRPRAAGDHRRRA